MGDTTGTSKFLEFVRDGVVAREASLCPPCLDAGATRAVADLAQLSEGELGKMIEDAVASSGKPPISRERWFRRSRAGF